MHPLHFLGPHFPFILDLQLKEIEDYYTALAGSSLFFLVCLLALVFQHHALGMAYNIDSDT